MLVSQLYRKLCDTSIFVKMGLAILVGITLGLYFKDLLLMNLIANLFIGSLKALAPILVFFLICSSLAKSSSKVGGMLSVVALVYISTTFLAAICAVSMSFAFPVKMVLNQAADGNVVSNITEIISMQVLRIVDNPVKALMEANYLSILFWSLLMGFILKRTANAATLNIISNISDTVNKSIALIVRFAPIGIMGLVYVSVSQNGIGVFYDYGKLILLLVSIMTFSALILNPIVVWIMTRKNPYPLVFICLKESGITAFFTRSSAANIPINMNLCEKLQLDKDFYSVSIALGSTINMNGAAITITTITLAICNTIGLEVNFLAAVGLCLVAVVSACGASGVAGGSLLLIPLACSLFGISDDIAMQGVFVGFIIGVIQDSVETALNSSSDVLFTAATQYYYRRKNNAPINYLGDFAKK